VVMDNFKADLPDISYRRVAINARNPKFEADQREKEMIRYFNDHPLAKSWQGIRTFGDEKYFLKCSPVRYDESCLHCHGRPEDAPRSIVETYGVTGGFARKTDQISSVVCVGIPVGEGMRRIGKFAFSVFSTVFLSFFCMYAIIAFFFNRLIIQNIRTLLDIFRLNLTDQKGEQLFRQARSQDEIGELNATATLIARHLQENRLQLTNYAENLEGMVEERTRALQESQDQLHTQMQERNRELQTLNTIAELITQSVDLSAILPKVLRQALAVIPARGAGIYLFHPDRQGLTLQCQDNAPELATSLACDMISHQIPAAAEGNASASSTICETACGELNFFTADPPDGKCLNIPLCCRQRILGIMTFTGYDVAEIDPRHRELLLSIGRQVGVTMESLQNMAGLTLSKELLQSVFDAIADLVVLVSPDGLLRMVNKAFLDRYNFRPDTILNRHIEELAAMQPVPFELFRPIFHIRLREPVSDFSRLPNGQIFETHFYPAFDDNGELKNVVCYAKDVTQQKQVEHRMQQAEKLVALGQLAAGVAHEINNPLGIILCYTNLLKDDFAGLPDKIDDLGIIEKHARNCQRIVQDLLSFARNQQTTKAPGSLNAAIEQVFFMVAGQLAKQGITVAQKLDPDIPPLEMDTEKMKQVFMNLFINSAQAIVNNGEISIETNCIRAKGQVKIVVRDSGPGIPPEIQNKIFEPFFTTKGPQDGTGLGLSLSYGIVRDHDGEIYVQSKPGKGAAFVIVLPLPGA
ncbi:MAG: ATP-binding protein, partial [Desulfobulbaceae bacterium]